MSLGPPTVLLGWENSNALQQEEFDTLVTTQCRRLSGITHQPGFINTAEQVACQLRTSMRSGASA